MSAENDLALAYHMGYDDALGKRIPDASKAQILAPYDLAAENVKLREQSERLFDKTLELGTENAKMRELVRLIYHHDRTPTIDELEAWHADGDEIEQRMRELGVKVEG